MTKISDSEVSTDQEPEIIELVNLYDADEKFYTRSFQGFYRNLRISGGLVLFSLYFLTVWFNIGDRQAIWFDLFKRQFHVFWITYYPQDFILLSCVLIICAMGLFFVTVLFGRLWCGYTCPQSVYTWVFLRVEHFFEGDRNQRKKFDKQPMTAGKLLRKFSKHGTWLAIGLATGLTFVGYFVPIRSLVIEFLTGEISNGALFWVVFFTLATYGNAGWLREKVCIFMCPYARFQAVMYDGDTRTVWYDHRRGEKRGGRKKTLDRSTSDLGDCIDCQMCVQVCPVNIDIRDGLQYECITCAACIDACDSVMKKMDYDTGLIRYSTENEIVKGKESKIIRPRLLGYFFVLLVFITAFLIIGFNRKLVEMEVVRQDRHSLYTQTEFGFVENVYMMKVINKAQKVQVYGVSVDGPKGLVYQGAKHIVVQPGELLNVPIRISIPSDSFVDIGRRYVFFHVISNDDNVILISRKLTFLGPLIKR